MKKYLLLPLLAAAALSQNTAAETLWRLQDNSFTVDTLSHTSIAPSTTLTVMALSGARPVKVHCVTTDLSDPRLGMRVTTGADMVSGRATLSDMQKAGSSDSLICFAGVNADFFEFDTDAPIGSTIVNGEIYLARDTAGWVNFCVNASGRPSIERLRFSGTVTAPDGSFCRLAGVNSGNADDDLVLYTPRRGASTSTGMDAAEVSVLPVAGHLAFDGALTLRVSGKPSPEGSISIAPDGMVLSGYGNAAPFVSALSPADTLTVVTAALPADAQTDAIPSSATPAPRHAGKISQMACGNPILLADGVTLDTEDALPHCPQLHPRTAVGYDATRTRLVLLVADGRQASISEGLTTKELADLMRYLGCTDALNLDGGGSSELFVHPLPTPTAASAVSETSPTSEPSNILPDNAPYPAGVVNRPSDGCERPVADALWLTLRP